MRFINFVFQLHKAYQIKPINDVNTELFTGEADFREVNRTEYQPFFALLERNIQKLPTLHVSLLVSGVWLEQAEKWDPELIRRLKRLVNKGNVQLIASLYDFSIAEFFDMDEAEVQLALLMKKFDQVFGVQPEVIAFPGLVYHKDLAKLAAKHHFKVILTAGLEEYLDFQNTNQVFEIKDVDNLKLININKKFSDALAKAGPLAMREELVKATEFDITDNMEKATTKHKSTAEEFVRGMAKDKKQKKISESTLMKTTGKLIYSTLKFSKELGLEMLNSNMVTIFLDTKVLADGRDNGVVRFFDEFFQEWSKDKRNKFLNLAEVLENMPVRYEIDFGGTANLWGFAADGLKVPDIFAGSLPRKLSQHIYDMREDVVRGKDRALYEDFGRFTTYDYLLDLNNERLKNIQLVLDIFMGRVRDKLPQPAKLVAENEKNVPARQEDFSVTVKRVAKPKKKTVIPDEKMQEEDDEEEVDAETLAAEEALARQISRKKADMEGNLGSLAEAELVQERKKVSKKLVIE